MAVGSNSLNPNPPTVKQSSEYPHYLAFSDGRVFSLYTNSFVKLHECKSTGYLQFSAVENGKTKNLKVHRFIAETLVPGKTNEENVVNHKDEKKLNNKVENLEWVTAAENVVYGTAVERRISSAGLENLRASAEHARSFRKKRVRNVDTGEVFQSVADAARAYRVKSHANIISACNGRYKTCAGYRWEYYKEVG